MLWARSVHFKPGIYTAGEKTAGQLRCRVQGCPCLPATTAPCAHVPFVINAEAGQPGYRVPLQQLLQADHTLAGILGQHVVWRGEESTGDTGALRPCLGRGSAPHSPLSWASAHLPSPLLGRIAGQHGPAGHRSLW